MKLPSKGGAQLLTDGHRIKFLLSLRRYGMAFGWGLINPILRYDTSSI